MATTNPAPTEQQAPPADDVSPELAVYLDVMGSNHEALRAPRLPRVQS